MIHLHSNGTTGRTRVGVGLGRASPGVPMTMGACCFSPSCSSLSPTLQTSSRWGTAAGCSA